MFVFVTREDIKLYIEMGWTVRRNERL